MLGDAPAGLWALPRAVTSRASPDGERGNPFNMIAIIYFLYIFRLRIPMKRQEAALRGKSAAEAERIWMGKEARRRQ